MKIELKRVEKKLNRSQRDIQNSMINLMKSVPYSAITVTMIANDACINRKTFYAHYHSKDELFFAMVYDMFDDLFGGFMYGKGTPGDTLDEGKLQEDVRNFLKKVVHYKESLLALVTDETSEVSVSIADRVVLNHCKDICFLDHADDTVLRTFYLEVVRNFFMGIIDAWMESESIPLDEGVTVLAKIMQHSFVNMFCYVKPAQGQNS